MVDGSEAAAALFDDMVELAEQWVDIHSHALLSPDLAAQAHAAYEQLQARRPAAAAGPPAAAEGQR